MNHVSSPREDDESVEQSLQRLGKTAPRLTPDDIEAVIASEHYFTAAQGVEGVGHASRLAAAIAAGGDPFGDGEAIVDPALPLLTFCVLVLRNGFTVTGESACVSAENFDADIGKRVARAAAKQKIWPLEGYLLKERLFQQSETDL